MLEHVWETVCLIWHEANCKNQYFVNSLLVIKILSLSLTSNSQLMITAPPCHVKRVSSQDLNYVQILAKCVCSCYLSSLYSCSLIRKGGILIYLPYTVVAMISWIHVNYLEHVVCAIHVITWCINNLILFKICKLTCV